MRTVLRGAALFLCHIRGLAFYVKDFRIVLKSSFISHTGSRSLDNDRDLHNVVFCCISPEEEAIASKASVIDVREFCLLVFVQITKKRYIDRELPSPAYIQSFKNKQTGQIQIL